MMESNLQSVALKMKSNDYSDLEKKYFAKTNISLLDPFAIPPKINSKKRLSATIIIPSGNAQSSIIKCLTSINKVAST